MVLESMIVKSKMLNNWIKVLGFNEIPFEQEETIIYKASQSGERADGTPIKGVVFRYGKNPYSCIHNNTRIEDLCKVIEQLRQRPPKDLVGAPHDAKIELFNIILDEIYVISCCKYMFIINRSRDRLPLKCIIYDEYTNYNNTLDFEKDTSSSSLTKSPQCSPHDLYNFLLIREGRKLKRIKPDYALKIGLFKTTQSAASVLLSQCPPPTAPCDSERHGPKHSPREFGSGMLGEISFSERIKDARVMISILNTEYVPKSGGYRWIGEAGRIPSELLISVVYGAYKLIRAEPSLIELKSPVAIFGDVFGNYRDLRKFTDILKIEEDQPRNFLFLGNYVDKGQSPIEVLAYLCSLKILYPDRIFMLCGNHDYVNIEKSKTSFYHLCKDVYSIYDRSEADKIYPYISVMLSNLPCAASVDHEIFCSHGGIPRIVSKDPSYDILSKVREITRPFSKNDQLHTLIFYDLIWSDPIYTKSDDGSIPEEVENDSQNPFPKYFYPSPRTNYSRDPNDICSFSKMALVNFLRRIGHKYMIRSHQHYEDYFGLQYTGELFTIFTSTEVSDKNCSHVILYENSKFNIIVLQN